MRHAKALRFLCVAVGMLAAAQTPAQQPVSAQASAHTGSQPNAAQTVLDAVLRVCNDMNVECSQAKQ